jgi:hypothetical protein
MDVRLEAARRAFAAQAKAAGQGFPEVAEGFPKRSSNISLSRVLLARMRKVCGGVVFNVVGSRLFVHPGRYSF